MSCFILLVRENLKFMNHLYIEISELYLISIFLYIMRFFSLSLTQEQNICTKLHCPSRYKGNQ